MRQIMRLIIISSSLHTAVAATVSAEHVLFVCGGNTGRSPMAEYLTNDYFKFSGYVASSRGVKVNSNELTPESNAVTVMQEWGVDMRAHRAEAVTASAIDQARVVLAMTSAHKQTLLAMDPQASNIHTLSECADGSEVDVADAYGHDLSYYRKTRDQIAGYIQLIKHHGFHCVK